MSLRAGVLAALDEGIRAGAVDAGRAAVRRDPDWAARALIRRAFEKRLLDGMLAAEAAPNAAADPGMVHPMRVASLQLRGLAHDASDPAATADAYARAGTLPKRGGLPVVTLATAAALSLLAAGVIWFVLSLPGPGRKSFARPRPAPRPDAFVVGGAPLADEGLRALLAEPLMEFVIAIDRAVVRGDGDYQPALAALREHPWISATGGPIALAWTSLLEAYDAWGRGEHDSGPGELIRLDALSAAVRTFNQAMFDAGLGYFVEVDTMTVRGARLRALIYSYQIELVSLLSGGGETRRVFDVRRVDSLNYSHAALGLESAELGDPLVMLDKIEDHVRAEVIEAMGAKGLFQLGDEAWQGYRDASERYQQAAAAALRDEFARALGPLGANARTTGALLTERRYLLKLVADEMRARNLELRRPNGLFLPDGFIAELGDFATVYRDRLFEIERTLAQADAAQVAVRIEDVLIATTRIHEAQHAIDGSEVRPLPPEVAAYTGAEEIGDEENAYATRVNSEVSAYLSEIANASTPKTTLWALSDFAFDHVSPRRVYRDTGLIVVAGIAQDAGLTHAPLIADRKVDRRALGDLLVALSGQPPAALANAARATWQRFYGTPMPVITAQPPPP